MNNLNRKSFKEQIKDTRMFNEKLNEQSSQTIFNLSPIAMVKASWVAAGDSWSKRLTVVIATMLGVGIGPAIVYFAMKIWGHA